VRPYVHNLYRHLAACDLAVVQGGLTTAMEQFLERRHAGLVRLDAHLNALSPQQVLQRGYSIVSRLDGHIVQDGAQLAPGDDVTMTFARGSARATVNSSRS
jgi:exodeoxyribonuclease VII large subunit